jgi:phosphohistidine phosphatase SixA
MNKGICLFWSLMVLVSCRVQEYTIVRHAEKATQEANMSSDVPLTDAGKQRAEKLAGLLAGKKLSAVYSTNTLRTRSTAQPTADRFGIPVQLYGPRPDSAFIQSLLLWKGNVLIVGHSNTVDDLVNGLLGKAQLKDLPETVYDRLYTIQRRGKKTKLVERGY